jgi:hypothetical protein
MSTILQDVTFDDLLCSELHAPKVDPLMRVQPVIGRKERQNLVIKLMIMALSLFSHKDSREDYYYSHTHSALIYRAISYCDIYLSTKEVKKCEYRLFLVTSIWIAMKMEHSDDIVIDDIIQLLPSKKYNAQHLIYSEGVFLATIKYRLHFPMVIDFIDILLRDASAAGVLKPTDDDKITIIRYTDTAYLSDIVLRYKLSVIADCILSIVFPKFNVKHIVIDCVNDLKLQFMLIKKNLRV